MEKHKDPEAEGEVAPQKHNDAARASHPAIEPAKEVFQPSRADKAASAPRTSTKTARNNVRKMRTERMMSKAELARRAGMSTLTIDRVERGLPCRMDTKRKILEALGLKPTDRVAVFGDEED